MENDNSAQPHHRRKSPLTWFFLGILPIFSGVLDILVSFNILEYVDTRPNQIAIFNNPHRWEVTMLGATLVFFGIANILPARMKFLGRLNVCFLIVSFISVVIGVIAQKMK